MIRSLKSNVKNEQARVWCRRTFAIAEDVDWIDVVFFKIFILPNADLVCSLEFDFVLAAGSFDVLVADPGNECAPDGTRTSIADTMHCFISAMLILHPNRMHIVVLVKENVNSTHNVVAQSRISKGFGIRKRSGLVNKHIPLSQSYLHRDKALHTSRVTLARRLSHRTYRVQRLRM